MGYPFKNVSNNVGSGHSREQLPVDDIPKEEPCAREPKVMSRGSRGGYFQNGEKERGCSVIAVGNN